MAITALIAYRKTTSLKDAKQHLAYFMQGSQPESLIPKERNRSQINVTQLLTPAP